MATVKCILGKGMRGRPTHEWNDGVKDHIYCLGRTDPMTDCPLEECLNCKDFVDKAQDDLDEFLKNNIYGHWIDTHINDEHCYKCSVCGNCIKAVWTSCFDFKYCPNCGESMNLDIDELE